MTLLVDIGNSRVKWAQLATSGLTNQQAWTWRSTGLAPMLNEAWSSMERPEAIWISNVAGAGVASTLREWTRDNWGIEPDFATVTGGAHGVTNHYIVPEQLGVDRWLALLGAWSLYRGAACVVDCGTAITIDALSAQGEFLGGVVAPGAALMREALSRGTAAAAEEQAEHVELTARTTQDAVTSGCMLAGAALIDRMASELRDRLGQEARHVITGGAATALLPLMRQRFEVVPDLVLRGLVFHFEHR